MTVYRPPARPALELYAALSLVVSSLPAVVPATLDDESALDRIAAKLEEAKLAAAEIALRRGVNAEALFAPRPAPKPVTPDDLTKPKRRTDQ